MLTVLKSGSLNLLEPSRPVQACSGFALILPTVNRVRSLGRPKNRWEDDVKSDITRMKISKEGLHQRPDQMEDTRCEGQNFSEVVTPQKEEEERNHVRKSSKEALGECFRLADTCRSVPDAFLKKVLVRGCIED